MTKEYVGKRAPGGDATVYIKEAGAIRPLKPRFDLANHSPTGFEWGYAGSGPAQLALAILADHLRDDARALKFYQRFKNRTIAYLDRRDGFVLKPADIDTALAAIREKEKSDD